jgi:hypothetical protein
MNYKFTYLVEEDLWRLEENIKVKLSNNEWITIPIGLKTDGRSSPKFLRNILPQFNRQILAFLIHDYLYISNYKWNELGTRKAQKFADDEMLFWELKLGMGKFEAYSCYWAVKLFGRSVYLQ